MEPDTVVIKPNDEFEAIALALQVARLFVAMSPLVDMVVLPYASKAMMKAATGSSQRLLDTGLLQWKCGMQEPFPPSEFNAGLDSLVHSIDVTRSLLDAYVCTQTLGFGAEVER